MRFHSLNVDDGLSNNAVRTINQDKQGVIWFGTELGLTKYDGYLFKTYKANNDQLNSLASSYVISIQIDDSNTVWLGGEKGLSRYRPESDDFVTIQHDIQNKNSLSSDLISAMQLGSEGILWIATDKGLDRYDTINETFSHYQYSPENQYSVPSNHIRALYRSHDGTMWVGSSNGLAYFDREKNQFNRINLTEKKQPFIRSIAENQSGEIWIATLQGLFSFDTTTSSVEKIQFSQKVNRFYTTLVDFENNLWVGSSSYGLFRIDSENEITNFRADKSDAKSLAGKTIISLYQDQSGIIWTGSYGDGVSSFNPYSLEFGAYDNSINSLSCLKSADIRSSVAINEFILWLGTTSGLTQVNLKQKTCKNYGTNSSRKSSLSNNEVFAIHRDSDDYLWLGTQAGLEGFNHKTQLFKKYGDSIINSAVLKIREHGSFIIIGANDGLYKLDLTNKNITKISNSENNGEPIKIYTFDIDQQGGVWIASDAGLLFMDDKLESFNKIKMMSELPNDQIVRTIAVDVDDRIWLTIEGRGLLEYNPKLRLFHNLGKNIGLKTTEGLIGLYTDDLNDLWLATLSSGLYKIDNDRTKLTEYHVSDGLHSETFNFRSFTKFPDGRVLFGGKSGFNLFHPLKLKINQMPPIVSLTQLKRFGKLVLPNQDYDGFKIDRNISELDELRLSHKDSVFGFDFIATHYLDPDKIMYAYKLEGFDMDWINTNAQNRGVTYNNINPGKYIFRLKAKTKNGVWSVDDIALKILISPAPWLTWWAYTAYVMSLVLAIIIFVKKRTGLLRIRAIRLQEKIEEKTRELVFEKNKVEQLLSQKNEEFANISHEFRTPLTLILGPVQQIQAREPSQYINSKMEVIERNGHRLLRMVDQLLHLETFRVKSITQRCVQDFHTIIKLIADSFQELAQIEGVQLTVNRLETIYFQFTPDALEKIILNLLSNALKYTPAGGAIVISAKRNENDHFTIVVEDTGIGIPEDKIDSIFERFQRVVNEHAKRVTGAGIGLSLVKALVEAHDGKISVESQIGKGTIFTVELPIFREVKSIGRPYHSNEEIISLELKSLAPQSTVNTFSEIFPTVKKRHRYNVLIVEDNPDMRNYIIELLSSEYNCTVANNGEVGFELATTEIPDIVISDIMMPKMDGYQLSNAIRAEQKTSHIPIVLLTARGDRESRLKGWNNKIDEYLTKPFDLEELLIRVQNLLDIRELLQKKFSESLFKETATISPKENQESAKTNSKECSFLNHLDRTLESLYTDSELKIDSIANNMAMSQRQLLRKLKGVLNMTPVEYLKLYRLDKARKRLLQSEPASNVALDVGFSSHSHFGMCFKIQYGCTPSEYK